MKRIIAVLIASLALNALVQRLDFPTINALFLDLRQQFSFDPPTSGQIATVTIPIEDRARLGMYSTDFVKENLEAIEKYKPKAILLTLTNADFAQKEFAPLRKMLDKFSNVYVLMADAKDTYSLLALPEFKDFAKPLYYYVPVDRSMWARDGRPRRILLTYKTKNEENEDYPGLRESLGLNIDLSKFKHAFDFQNTDQIFFKMRSVGSYGQHSTTDVREGKVPAEALAGKIVILGGFDEFDFYAFKSFFRRLSRESEAFTKNQYWPANEVLANHFDTLTMATYVKSPPNWVDQVFCISLLFAFMYMLIITPPNLAAILSVPFILSTAILGWLIYLFTDFALDITRPTVVMFSIHFLAVPLILAKYVRRKERERAEIKHQVESEIQRNRFLARSARADMGFKLSLQVAHDLRSPVSAIQLVADLSRKHLSEDMHRLLKESVDRLNGMAQDLLTRFKDGQMESPPTSVGVDLVQSLENVVAPFRKRCPEIQFDLKLPEGTTWVSISTIYFERAMTNLIGNAVEALTLAATPQPRVEISLEVNTEEIILHIQDNGPGVPKELTGKLFQMGSTHGKASGTGLGLNQARGVFTQAGGDLRLVETASGACFEARIPRQNGVVQLKLQPNILLAEDSAQVRDLWAAALAGKNVEVVSEPVAAQAILERWAAEKRPFTLITDLIFSGSELTGFDLIDLAEGDCILCTTLAQHPEVISYAERHQIQLLAKEDILKLSVEDI